MIQAQTPPPPDAARKASTSAQPPDFGRPVTGWRLRLHTVIFEADTRAGRAFDLTLIGLIVASVGVVMLDSVATVNARYSELFNVLEWGFTVLFTVEYLCRLACVRHPQRYARSTLGQR